MNAKKIIPEWYDTYGSVLLKNCLKKSFSFSKMQNAHLYNIIFQTRYKMMAWKMRTNLVIHLNAVTTRSDEIRTNFSHSSQCGHTQKFSWTVLGKNQSAIYYVITRRYICQTNKYIACIWTFQKVCKYYFSIFFYILKQKWFHFWHLCPYNKFY